MNDETKTEAETTLSPKVTAQAVTSVVLVVLVAAINAITPELFSFLGDFAGIAFAAVVALGGALAGFLKGDPLRG